MTSSWSYTSTFPKARRSHHDHQGQDIFFSVVKGQVKATLNNSEEHTLSPGTLLHFAGEAFIGIEALVDSEFFVYLINL